MEIIKFESVHPELTERDTDITHAGVDVTLTQYEYEFLKVAARQHFDRIQEANRKGCCSDDFADVARATYLRIDRSMRQIGNFDWPKSK